jgi:Amidohydrolase family
MSFGIGCYGWFRQSACAACVLLFGIASSVAQNTIAKDTQPAQTVVVRAGRLFDPLTGRMLDRPVVVIAGNKISSVSNGNPPSISGATLIDLGDATLLPGFIDVHTHLTSDAGGGGYEGLGISSPRAALIGAKNARLTLLAGFTTVRIVGAEGVLGRGPPRCHQCRRPDRPPNAGLRPSPAHYWRTLRQQPVALRIPSFRGRPGRWPRGGDASCARGHQIWRRCRSSFDRRWSNSP